jgi:hypothetical protein
MKRLLAAALLAALASPAAAQLAPQQAPQEQAAPQDDGQMVAALRRSVAAARRHMFAPGPAVPGWNSGGADPEAELRAAGADDHVLLVTGGEGPSVVLLTARSIAAVAPAGWRIADSYGSAGVRVADPHLEFGRLTPRYVAAARYGSHRVGTADCSDPVTHAILYEVPGAPSSPDDETMAAIFRLVMLAGEEQVTCTRYERDGSTYRATTFLPDGHSLPQLGSVDARTRVVPAAPLETLLATPPAEAAPAS